MHRWIRKLKNVRILFHSPQTEWNITHHMQCKEKKGEWEGTDHTMHSL